MFIIRWKNSRYCCTVINGLNGCMESLKTKLGIMYNVLDLYCNRCLTDVYIRSEE